jgi:DNA-binding NtrC family response regulator
VVLCDLLLPDGRSTELLRELREVADTEVILLTGNASVETAVEALRLAAYDYLTKPIDLARLTSLLAGLKRTRKLRSEVTNLRRDLRGLGRFGRMIGASTAMQKVYDLVERVARTDASVLLVGESGTGKEVAAQTVHELGPRADAPFVPVNCGAISQNLIESELFGHEKGSFTGAAKQHRGVFERAHGGTLFLDEITEMPPELQVKLLRVLETAAVTRVGGDREIPVDVRIVAATNRRPEEAVRDGRLREDLFYRLAVFPIELPPLAARGTDVKLLAEHFLAELVQAEGTTKVFATSALDAMAQHPWPGNVRELRNVVRRASIVADEVIGADDLGLGLAMGAPDSGPLLKFRVPVRLDEVERRLVLATLEVFEQDKPRAAEALGISLKTVYNRLNAYAEDPSDTES